MGLSKIKIIYVVIFLLTAFLTYEVCTNISYQEIEAEDYDQKSLVIMDNNTIAKVHKSKYDVYQVDPPDSIKISKADSTYKFKIKNKSVQFYGSDPQEEVSKKIKKYLDKSGYDTIQVKPKKISELQTAKRDSTFKAKTISANNIYNKRKITPLKYDSNLGYQFFIKPLDSIFIFAGQLFLLGLITLLGFLIFKSSFKKLSKKIKSSPSSEKPDPEITGGASEKDPNGRDDEKEDTPPEEEIFDFPTEENNEDYQKLIDSFNEKIAVKDDIINKLNTQVSQFNTDDLEARLEVYKDKFNQQSKLIKGLEDYKSGIEKTLSKLNKNSKQENQTNLINLLNKFKVENPTIASLKEYLNEANTIALKNKTIAHKINNTNLIGVPSALDLSKDIIKLFDDTKAETLNSIDKIKTIHEVTRGEQLDKIDTLTEELKLKKEHIEHLETTNEKFDSYWKNAKEKYYKSLRNDDLGLVKQSLFEMGLHYYSLLAVTNKKEPNNADLLNFESLVNNMDSKSLRSKGTPFDIYQSVQNSKVSNNIFKILLKGDEHVVKDFGGVLVDGFSLDLSKLNNE